MRVSPAMELTPDCDDTGFLSRAATADVAGQRVVSGVARDPHQPWVIGGVDHEASGNTEASAGPTRSRPIRARALGGHRRRRSHGARAAMRRVAASPVHLSASTPSAIFVRPQPWRLSPTGSRRGRARRARPRRSRSTDRTGFSALNTRSRVTLPVAHAARLQHAPASGVAATHFAADSDDPRPRAGDAIRGEPVCAIELVARDGATRRATRRCVACALRRDARSLGDRIGSPQRLRRTYRRAYASWASPWRLERRRGRVARSRDRGSDREGNSFAQAVSPFGREVADPLRQVTGPQRRRGGRAAPSASRPASVRTAGARSGMRARLKRIAASPSGSRRVTAAHRRQPACLLRHDPRRATTTPGRQRPRRAQIIARRQSVRTHAGTTRPRPARRRT